MVGYDMDGVLVQKMPEWVWWFGTTVGNIVRLFYPVKRRPAEDQFIIITSRPRETDEFYTTLWLRLHRIKPEQLFMTGDFTGTLKIMLVRELRLEKFYEDDPSIIARMKAQHLNVEEVK